MDQLVIDHVTHSYEDEKGKIFTVLRDVSITWHKGETLALMGESGSGKSTIARLCIGVEKPTCGRIILNGEDTSAWGFHTWRSHRGELQAVFQDASGTLNPARSVRQNMSEALIDLTQHTKREREAIIGELMAHMDLDPALLKTPVRHLSGGEQRRISLLRALSVHPDYLILDEVTSGLDLISADMVLTTLEKYREHYGCSYLFISHDEQQAKRLADRVLILEEGRLVREGLPE